MTIVRFFPPVITPGTDMVAEDRIPTLPDRPGALLGTAVLLALLLATHRVWLILSHALTLPFNNDFSGLMVLAELVEMPALLAPTPALHRVWLIMSPALTLPFNNDIFGLMVLAELVEMPALLAPTLAIHRV